ARAARCAHRTARSRDRRPALAGERRRGWRRGAVAARAAPDVGTQLSRAIVARAAALFHHPRGRVRDLVVRTVGDGRDSVARVAGERDAARAPATAAGTTLAACR